MRYEVKIQIEDQEYLDDLIVSLVRQGYEVYLGDNDRSLYFTTLEDDVYKIQED